MNEYIKSIGSRYEFLEIIAAVLFTEKKKEEYLINRLPRVDPNVLTEADHQFEMPRDLHK